MTDYENRLRDFGLSDSQLRIVLEDIDRAITEAQVELREKLDMYRNGYQGSCIACEPVAQENQRLQSEVNKLKEALNDCSRLLNEHIEPTSEPSPKTDRPGKGFPGPEHQTEGWKRKNKSKN